MFNSYSSYVKLPEGKLYSKNPWLKPAGTGTWSHKRMISGFWGILLGIVTCMPVSNRSTANHKTSWWNDISQKFTRRSGAGTNSIWLKSYSSLLLHSDTHLYTCNPRIKKKTENDWCLISVQFPGRRLLEVQTILKAFDLFDAVFLKTTGPEAAGFSWPGPEMLWTLLHDFFPFQNVVDSFFQNVVDSLTQVLLNFWGPLKSSLNAHRLVQLSSSIVNASRNWECSSFACWG